MRWLAVIVCVISTLWSKAEVSDPAGLMQEANHYYEKAAYDTSAILYLQIAEEYESSDLYLNMGNAYYKQDSIAKAVLYYERALKLNPANDDAYMNLRIINQKVLDEVGAGSPTKIARWWHKLTGSANWPVLAIVFQIIGFGLLVTYLVVRKRIHKQLVFYTGVAVVVLGVFAHILAANYYGFRNANDTAIILQFEVSAQTSPAENAELAFVLHEGSKVQITDTSNGWVEIQLPNGLVGWVNEDVLEVI